MEQSCEQVRVSITTEPSRVLSQASHPCVGRGNDGIQNEVKKGERDGPIGKRAILHRCKGLLVSDWFYDLKNIGLTQRLCGTVSIRPSQMIWRKDLGTSTR
jgi:hypothetical protein